MRFKYNKYNENNKTIILTTFLKENILLLITHIINSISFKYPI